NDASRSALFKYLTHKFKEDPEVLSQLSDMISDVEKNAKQPRANKMTEKTAAPSYKDENKPNTTQPGRNMMKFEITRAYSTGSNDGNGYLCIDVAWNPESMKNMHPN